MDHQRDKSFLFLKQLLILYAVTLFLGACFAPLLIKLIQWIHASSPSSLTQYLSRKPIGVYIDRIRLLGMLIGVVFLFRNYKDIFKTPWLELKKQESIFTKSFWTLFFLGVFLAGILIFGQMKFGSCVRRNDLEVLSACALILRLIFTSFLVSFLEEYFFRGLVFKNLTNVFNSRLAIIASSVLFASLHFNGRGVELVSQNIFGQSFETAWYMFCGPCFQWNWIIFTNLTLLGIILGLLYQASGSLRLAIAFHGGVAFGALFSKKMMIATDLPPSSWGSLKLVDSNYAIFLFILVLFFIFYLNEKNYFGERSSKS